MDCIESFLNKGSLNKLSKEERIFFTKAINEMHAYAGMIIKSGMYHSYDCADFIRGYNVIGKKMMNNEIKDLRSFIDNDIKPLYKIYESTAYTLKDRKDTDV